LLNFFLQKIDLFILWRNKEMFDESENEFLMASKRKGVVHQVTNVQGNFRGYFPLEHHLLFSQTRTPNKKKREMKVKGLGLTVTLTDAENHEFIKRNWDAVMRFLAKGEVDAKDPWDFLDKVVAGKYCHKNFFIE